MKKQITELNFEELAKDYFCFVIDRMHNNKPLHLYCASRIYHISEIAKAKEELLDKIIEMQESFNNNGNEIHLASGKFDAADTNVCDKSFYSLFVTNEKGEITETLYTGYFQKVHHYFSTHFNSMRDAKFTN